MVGLAIPEGIHSVQVGWAERAYTQIRGYPYVRVDFLTEGFPTLFLVVHPQMNMYRYAWARRHRLQYDAPDTLVPQDPSWMLYRWMSVRVKHEPYKDPYPMVYRTDFKGWIGW